jgi:hypothetical protein
MAMGKWANVAGARVGSGAVFIGIGLAGLALGAFWLVGGRADVELQAAGAFFITAGGGLTTFGVFIRMVSRIELRLMDIESAIRNPVRAEDEPTSKASSSPDAHWLG